LILPSLKKIAFTARKFLDVRAFDNEGAWMRHFVFIFQFDVSLVKADHRFLSKKWDMFRFQRDTPKLKAFSKDKGLKKRNIKNFRRDILEKARLSCSKVRIWTAYLYII
jgi:hypothetical protein